VALTVKTGVAMARCIPVRSKDMAAEPSRCSLSVFTRSAKSSSPQTLFK
jgi:hypothetical protein